MFFQSEESLLGFLLPSRRQTHREIPHPENGFGMTNRNGLRRLPNKKRRPNRSGRRFSWLDFGLEEEFARDLKLPRAAQGIAR